MFFLFLNVVLCCYFYSECFAAFALAVAAISAELRAILLNEIC